MLLNTEDSSLGSPFEYTTATDSRHCEQCWLPDARVLRGFGQVNYLTQRILIPLHNFSVTIHAILTTHMALGGPGSAMGRVSVTTLLPLVDVGGA